MEKTGLYAGAAIGNILLYSGSGRWYGVSWYTEWLFGLLAAGLFALLLRGWERVDGRGGGLVFMTALLLVTIDSIFFVQNLPAVICSLLLGFLLLPYFTVHKEAVMTAGGIVLLNVLINIEVGMETTLWLLFAAAGIMALLGFRLRFHSLKILYALLFSASVLMLMFLNLFDGAYLKDVLLLVLTLVFAAAMYKYSEIHGTENIG